MLHKQSLPQSVADNKVTDDFERAQLRTLLCYLNTTSPSHCCYGNPCLCLPFPQMCICCLYVFLTKLAVTCLTSLLIHIKKKVCVSRTKGCGADRDGETGRFSTMCLLSKQVGVIEGYKLCGSWQRSHWHGHKTLLSPPPSSREVLYTAHITHTGDFHLCTHSSSHL